MGGGATLDPSRTVAGCFPGQRLVSYCAGAVFMIVCGSLYAFSSISGDLQAAGYANVSLLGSAGNIGTYVLGIVMGIALDIVGSQKVAACAVLYISLGWLSLRYAIPHGSDVGVAFCFIAIGLGGATGFMSTNSSCAAQFSSKYRGLISGSLLAFYSASAAIWAPVYKTYFVGDLSKFCLVMCIVAAVAGVCSVAVTVNHKAAAAAAAGPAQTAGDAHVAGQMAIASPAVHNASPEVDAVVSSGAVAPAAPDVTEPKTVSPAEVVTSTAEEAHPTEQPVARMRAKSDFESDDEGEIEEEERRERAVHDGPSPVPEAAHESAASATPAISPDVDTDVAKNAVAVAATPASAAVVDVKAAIHGGDHVHHAHGVNVPLHDGTRLTSTNARVRRHAALHELHHASIIDMLLFRAPVAGFLFVMLYISCFVILGVALIFVNSAGLIIKAQHHAESTSTINALISNTVIIFAMCNTAARAFGGALTDWLAFRGYSRLHVLYVAGVMTLVGAFVLAYTPENAIIPVAVLIGLGDGLGFAVWPVFTCEIFGKARYGKMFAIMNSSVGFGSLAFNAMSSSIYSEHAYHNALGKLVCTEAACYKNTWVIAGALVTAIGVPTCLIVYWQQARYDLRHHDHRQHAAAIAGAGPGACPPAGQQPLSPGMLQPSAVPTPAVGARKYGRPVAHSWAEVNLGFNEPRQLPMFSPEPTPAASPSPAPVPVVSAPATSLKSAGQVV